MPPILTRSVRDPTVDEHDLSCIERFSSGAAPLSEEIVQLLKKKFPGTGFKQGYWMMDSCSCIIALKHDYEHAHKSTICASTKVKITDEAEKELGIGKLGELLARGPQITMGYWNNEIATRSTYYEQGFLRMGDEAVFDGDGMVMIMIKGIGVTPAEVEDLLLGHGSVEDVAFWGFGMSIRGIDRRLMLRRRGRVGKEILRYARERKARHKLVKEVEFIGEIPKSASEEYFEESVEGEE